MYDAQILYNLSHTLKFSILLVSVSAEESPSSLPSQSSGSESHQHQLSTGSDEHYEPHSESGSHEFEGEGREEALQSEGTTGRDSNGEGDRSTDVSDSDTVRGGSEEREGSLEDAGSGSEEDVIVQQVHTRY